MDANELAELLAQGESSRLELKESVPKPSDLRRVICAFANDWSELGGGVVVLGVTDDRRVAGVADADLAQRSLADAARNDVDPPLAPVIETVNLEGRTLVVAKVPTSLRRPHLAAGTLWIRVGTEVRSASLAEIQELLRRKAAATPTEDEPVARAEEEDLDWRQFEAYVAARPTAGLANGRSGREVARANGWLVQAGGSARPTLAAILLFGRMPERFVPWSAIDFARFLGVDRAAPVGDRHTFSGSLVEIVERCLAKVNDLSLTSYEFEPGDPRRREVHEYPSLVVREAVVNAVVHRDYAHRTATATVWMFHDRIEVQSPGGLYGRVRAENFGETTDYRNRRLADGFYHLSRMSEMIGRGVPFMKSEMQRNASPPPRFSFDPGYVQVTLPAQPSCVARRFHG